MAEKNDQEKPLTPSSYRHPATPSHISEDEAIAIALKRQHHHRRYRKHVICCGVCSASVLIVIVTLIILSFTVFHVKNPEISLNSVSLLGFNNMTGTAGFSLIAANLTVAADVSVKNPNAASFRFTNTTANLYYSGAVIGEADVPAGMARARRTVRMNLTFDVAVAGVAAVPGFAGDFTAGLIPVTSYTRIRGKVKILNMVKKSVTVTMNCSLSVNITGQVVQDQDCKQCISL